jgi:hypothetical protein
MDARIFTLATLTAMTLGLAPSAWADPQGTQLLFTQRDAVRAFDLNTGQGYQIGTVSGLVSGTSSAQFQFTPSGPPSGDALPIAFQYHVTVTDFDGDQLRFDAEGTGTFHLGAPGASFEGSGGPLQGTYTVGSASGKYSGWVGNTFAFKAIATNPSAPAGTLGTLLGEVTFRGRSDLK